MSEIVSLFGDYAGAIWRLLQDNGPLSEQELLSRTHLNQPQLCAAIGWLAREDKIRKENNTYVIGQTNLAPVIGKDAGKIWHALEIWGEVDSVSLARLSRIAEHDVFSAVGWLAREGKIDGILNAIDEQKILFWLK